MAQRRFHRTTVMLMVLSLMMAACDHGEGKPVTTTAPGGGGAATGVAPRLFGLRLSEGQALTTPTATEVVSGDELDTGRIDEILARLPDWTGGEAEQQPFNWPVQSPPPPRTGTTVTESFPPTVSTPPEEVPTGPLHVLRHQPDGDVSIAPFLSITFDQPMVAVGTVAQVDASDVPVTLTPALDGTWQWIGTKTLRFDSKRADIDRLPMATTYTVTVPAGTTSASGGTLAETVTWQFTTPAPSVVSFSPTGESLAVDQLFVAVFDQLVDPASVLATVHLRAGDREVAVRLATDAEVQADDSARQIVEQTHGARYVAFRSVDPLPTDTALTIAIGPGTPSAEGPATTTTAATYTGRTYAPLRVTDVTCASSDQCAPGSDLYVQFNNLLDTDRTDPSTVTVSPALAGQRAGVQGSTIVISGATLGRTTYTITVPASITDVFGQTLGAPVTRTVEVGSAPPSIEQYGVVTTLDPFADGQQLTALTVNHDKVRVRVFAADPSVFADYLEYSYRRDDPSVSMPDWTVLSDETLSVKSDPDATVATPIDLGKVFDGKPGMAIVLVEPVPAVPPQSNDYWQNRPALTWAQSTQLGVDAVADQQHAVVWATDLRTGAPQQGVTVHLSDTTQSVGTGDDGVARLELPGSAEQQRLVIATRGDDTAIMPVYAVKQAVNDVARWYVFDDRQVYRPGETMKVKGWVRTLSLSGDATLHRLGAGASLGYTVVDAYGNQLAAGRADLGALGGFDLSVDIPETANLGQASLNLALSGVGSVDGSIQPHTFQIQQYRTPEFEVATRAESQPPFLSTAPVTVAATASYYAGGPLASSAVDWRVTTSEGTYSPPGWSDFTFGVWHPWWYGDVYSGGSGGGARPAVAEAGVSDAPIGTSSETKVEEYQGTTDANGTHYLQIGFQGEDGTLPDLPVVVTAEATVTDVNRQAWASRTNLLVHAADRYVGLRTTRAFVRQGDPLDVQVIVTDVDGKAVPGVTLTVTAGRVEWAYARGQWGEKVVDTTSCAVTSATDAVPCRFDAPLGGQYRVTAVVADEHGGHNRTELTTWVSGAGTRPSTEVEQEALTIVPDKADYAPGDTAQLLVQSPFTTGEGLMTVSHDGIRSTQRFTVADGSAVLTVPVTEADLPTLTLGFEVVGSTPRIAADGTPLEGVPDRPAYAVGGLTLPVSLASRTLAVTATPRDAQVLPGGSTTIDLKVADATGAPVQGAELAVVVVDEAVLALSGYDLADPLAAFYGSWYETLYPTFSRSQVRLLDSELLPGGEGRDSGGTATSAVPAAPTTTAPASDESAGGGGENYGGKTSTGGTTPIEVRSRFEALALFAPSVTTDANGAGSVPVTLPDNLTRYRVMVVAAAGDDSFGKAESSITARLPLSVRPSAPRFANYGDRFELPVVVQNQGDSPLDVDVVLQTSNLGPDQPTGRSVSVPANGRVEVRFPVSTEQAGTAGYRVAVVSGDLADAATGSLPVYTPATAEAFATYGMVDQGAVLQPIVAPKDVIEQFGGLEITTSSTSLQALTDAVLYVTTYPYDSSDGRAARIMSIAALKDVLGAFDAAGLPAQSAIDKSVKADIDALVAMQRDDGGWSWWSRVDQSLPFNTVQVTHALLLARSNGYTVPQGTIDRALAYLADVESHIPAEYGDLERDAIRAYALWVRSLGGQRDPAKALALFDERGQTMQADALAWLWSSLDDRGAHAEVGRLLGNRVVETAGAANVTTNYDDGAYVIMHSDRRTDGIVLDALITEDSQSDLIPKLVNGLLAHRVQGRWDDIQENSFILLALHRYFTVYEAQTPDFVAKVWLGDRYAGDHTFSGRETDRVRFDLPMSDVVAAGDTNLVLAKDGTGRLYYRIGVRYAPTDLQLDPLDRGFVVTRTYEAVDDPADVRRDADGTWHIRAGALVRVKLTMVAESQRTHVALVDPLPAGLEALNPELEVTQTVSSGEEPSPVPLGGEWWWWGLPTWYEHQQLRDDRAEAFATLVPAGTYSYSYVARATTPGTFVTPPTRAEEMYAPETFGRAATDTVVVE